MKRALLLLLAALPLAAQDLATSVALDQTTAYTGERITGTFTVTNESALVANDVSIELGWSLPQQSVAIVDQPEIWSCGLTEEPGLFLRCSIPSVAGNARMDLRFTILLRNDRPAPSLRITGWVTSSFFRDADPANNLAHADVAIEPHPSVAALSVQATAPPSPVLVGTPGVIRVDVRNDGPAAANDIRLRMSWFFLVQPVVDAPGWTCNAGDCTRASLASGESAPVTLTFNTPVENPIHVRIIIGSEGSYDPVNEPVDVSFHFGDPTKWHRTLLPIAMAETPGANGSLWRTDVTVVLVWSLGELYPRYCAGKECPFTPIGRPFDFLAARWARPDPQIPSALVFEKDAPFDVNLRVRDLTRTAETWGTEIPAVRERAFRTSTIALMPLPVDPLFRTTLRVYDLDARPGALVAIHVHADDEEAPRTTLVRAFTTVPHTITPLVLAMFPGYLQLDPIAEAGRALDGAKTMWIRVEPLMPGLKFWAFASVTNNPTGHVTTVTPQ